MVRFITFEGGDGAGKTTHLKSLAYHLSALGRSCVMTREPGGTSLGTLIRQVLLEVGKGPIVSPAEVFLYLADRAQHVETVIRPAIESGKIVLCDRYIDSTLAYQGYGRGLDLVLLRQMNAVANQGVAPDLTFLLDCPVELSLSRATQRLLKKDSATGSEDRFERETREFHERVRAGFLELARAEPARFRVVDASRPVDEVTQEIARLTDRELEI
jgi:dTMP kinase